MNAGQMEEYLRVVEEMVMDEGKIVTYKILSRTLGVNVNTAKQLLHLYLIKQQKNTPCMLSATHLLAGSLKDGTFLVSIISDIKLNEAYSKYDKITSEHVYSIQKGKASALEKNSQMLFTVDSSIPPQKSYLIKYFKGLKEKAVDKVEKNVCQDKEVKTDAKSYEKQKENKVISVSPRKGEKQSAKKPGHISNFFNNQSLRKKVEKQVKSERTEDSPKKVDKSEPQETSVPDVVEVPDEEEAKEKPSGSSKSEKKVRVKERKKRKRIVSASEDSESDEEKADALLCSEPPVSEISERLRICDDDTDEDDVFEKKRKRKKVISKTVLHDDGFMETFKEVVYETDSDMESPKHKKKEAKMSEDGVTSEKAIDKVDKEESGGGKGKTPPQKTNPKKQSTLFSFFKKN